jgi:uncharacterized protein YraI
VNTLRSSFQYFVRHVLPPLAAALVLLLVIVLVTSTSSAQGCGINSFTMSPEHPLTVGQQVRLEGTSNCGTVKFTVRNTATGQVWDKAETGQPNQGDWWYTNETGAGNFEVCFLGRGPSGGWEVAARNCKAVFVQGGAGPNPSVQGCRITHFSAAPNSVPEGSPITISGSGTCGNGVRATRLLVRGNIISELGNGNLTATWHATGRGNAQVCVQVTTGDWNNSNETAQQCLDITVSDPRSNPGTGVALPATPTPQPNNGGGNNDNGGGGGSNSGSSNSCNSHQSFLFTGAIARVDYALRVNDAPDGRIIDDLGRGRLVTIIGGSECVRGALMWEIGYDGRQGWAPEMSTYGTYYMVNNNGSTNSGGNNSGSGNNNGGGSTSPRPTNRPTQPNQPSNTGCNALSRLSIGDTAYVSDQTPDPVPLRSGASTSHSIILQVAVREEVTITGGPSCSGDVVWWQVSYDGQRGWMAEINRFNNRNLIFVNGSENNPSDKSISIQTISNSEPWIVNSSFGDGRLNSQMRADLSVTFQDLGNNEILVRSAAIELEISGQKALFCVGHTWIKVLGENGEIIFTDDGLGFQVGPNSWLEKEAAIAPFVKTRNVAEVEFSLWWFCADIFELLHDESQDLSLEEIRSIEIDDGLEGELDSYSLFVRP